MRFDVSGSLKDPQDRQRILEVALEWLMLPALRRLFRLQGLAWPAEGDAARMSDALAIDSSVWDFRRGQERIEVQASVALPSAEIRDAADALGLIRPEPPARPHYSAILVPGGTAYACLKRTQLVRRLLEAGTTTDEIWLLGADREMKPQELEALGEFRSPLLAKANTEFDALLVAAEEFFGFRSAPGHSSPAGRTWSSFVSGQTDAGCPLKIVAAKSPVETRRANTGDNYRAFLDTRRRAVQQAFLICTTQIYAPYQFFSAIQTLCEEEAVSVELVGVAADDAVALLFNDANYLQEVRSGILGARNLIHRVLDSGANR